MLWLTSGLWFIAGAIFAQAHKGRKLDRELGLAPVRQPADAHREEEWWVC
jgi:hypothetical protein